MFAAARPVIGSIGARWTPANLSSAQGAAPATLSQKVWDVKIDFDGNMQGSLRLGVFDADGDGVAARDCGCDLLGDLIAGDAGIADAVRRAQAPGQEATSRIGQCVSRMNADPVEAGHVDEERQRTPEAL